MAQNPGANDLFPEANSTAPQQPAPAVGAEGNALVGSAMPEPLPAGPQPRDYAIAGVSFIVLVVAFFFAKNAYSNHLARRRVPYGPASAAGWWLFTCLTSLGLASILAILSPEKFLTALVMAPLCLIGVISLVLMLMSSKRS